MRRSLLAAVLALVLLAWPARAQLIPTGPPGAEQPVPLPEPAGMRTLLDVVMQVTPPSGPGFCMEVGAGQLTITTQLAQPANQQYPTHLSFGGYRGMDPGVVIETRIAERESSTTATLAGGLYCWNVGIDAPPGVQNMSDAELGAFTQKVALKMVLTPQ